jgi:hypothetical protein
MKEDKAIFTAELAIKGLYISTAWRSYIEGQPLSTPGVQECPWMWEWVCEILLKRTH